MGHKHAQRTFVSAGRLADGSTCLDFDYLEAHRLEAWVAASSAHPLAVISFGAPLSSALSCPTISLNLSQLYGPAQVEVWTSDQPVCICRKGNFTAATNQEVAAAFLTVDEERETPLEHVAYTTYCRMLRELHELGYPHLWRVWNYFPSINENEKGMERYQRFCIGRHQALAERLPNFPASLPAGTAIGTTSGPLHLFALAGTQPATHLGNPRQVNAYDYPQIYGPCSPSFARATATRLDGVERLFLAGTASVVGHSSRHPGSPEEQTREMLINLRTMMTHADDLAGTDFIGSQQQAVYKVYVRNKKDFSAIRQTLERSAFFPERVLFLQGNLCRRELLVEIEGLLASD